MRFLSAAGFTEEVKLKTFEDDDVKIDLVKESENRANLRASDAGNEWNHINKR